MRRENKNNRTKETRKKVENGLTNGPGEGRRENGERWSGGMEGKYRKEGMCKVLPLPGNPTIPHNHNTHTQKGSLCSFKLVEVWER